MQNDIYSVKVMNTEIAFFKPFDERELSIAKILRFQIKDNLCVVTDIRFSSPESVFYFLIQAYSRLMYDTDKIAFKQEVFDNIKFAYDKWKREWDAKYDIYNLYDNCTDDNGEMIKLKKHQIDCVWRATYKKNNLFALGLGTGKTLVAATISKLFKIPRTLVICPTVVKWNWMRDLSDKFGFDENSFTILDSRTTIKALVDERWVIVNYESLKKFKKDIIFQDVGHIILDECHYVKSTGALRYKLTKDIIDHFPKARLTMLSGTPITNRVTDMFSYIRLAKVPVLGTSKFKFKERYAKIVGKKIVGVQNIEELRGFLSNFMIRKKTTDCVDLPPIRTNKYYIDNSSKLTSEYALKMEEIVDSRKRYLEIEPEYLIVKEYEDNRKAKELRQEMFLLKAKARTNIISLNRLCAIAKVSSVIEMIDDLIEKGEKVIVFSQFIDPLLKLKYKYMNKCVYIDGSVSTLKRHEEIELFKKDKSKMVYIAQMVAGGIGVNLVNSSNVIFLDLPFTTDKIEQAQQRSWRMGQTKDVNVFYTILTDSIDEKIFSLIKSKGNDISSVIDDGKSDFDYNKVESILMDDILDKYSDTPMVKKKGFVKLK